MWGFANTVLQYVAMILQSLTARCATVMVLELALIEVDVTGNCKWRGVIREVGGYRHFRDSQ